VNKLSFEQLEDLIINFSTSIIDKETEDEIVWSLAKTCISKLGFEDCVIYLVDDKSQKLHQRAAYGPKNPKAFDIYEPIEIQLGEGITGSVAETGEPEIVNNTSKDKRYIVDDQSRMSEIAVPIMVGEKVLGVIDSEHSQPNYFHEYHLKILKAFASICGIKLLNVRKEKDLAEEQAKLLQIERELIDLRVKALKSQMNPHFVFNALSAVQFFITNNEKKDALKYLSVFSKLLRNYLEHLDKDFISVYEEVKILKQYLELQQLRYSDRLEFSLKVDDQLENYMIPSLVLQLTAEEIVERNMIENRGDANLLLELRLVDKKSMRANFLMKSKKTGDKREESYRSEKFSWENHIDLLNKLKQAGIEKNIFTEEKEGEIAIKFELSVPLNINNP